MLARDGFVYRHKMYVYEREIVVNYSDIQGVEVGQVYTLKHLLENNKELLLGGTYNLTKSALSILIFGTYVHMLWIGANSIYADIFSKVKSDWVWLDAEIESGEPDAYVDEKAETRAAWRM